MSCKNDHSVIPDTAKLINTDDLPNRLRNVGYTTHVELEYVCPECYAVLRNSKYLTEYDKALIAHFRSPLREKITQLENEVAVLKLTASANAITASISATSLRRFW